MQKPTWAVAVGIIGIVMGCFGLLGSGQTMMMPTIFEMQKQIFSEMRDADWEKIEHAGNRADTEKGVEQQGEGSGETAAAKSATGKCRSRPPVEMFGFMEKFWNFPPWFKTWSLAAGITGIFVSGFYIFASILLLLVRKNGIRLFYWAAGISIALSLAKGIAGVMANPLIGVSMMVWSIVGIVISVVLIIVVATSDKQAFGYAPKLKPPA